ncbi:MAG: aminotransferase class V-fold PLP-dependent enzyme, partial [Mucilaginibacter sp.]
MTTSDYPEGFPDIAELEKLANQFFKALPGDATKRAPGMGQFVQQLQGIDMNTSNPLSIGDIPASAAYSGLPPSGTNIFGGVDSPYTQPPVLSPFPAGFGFNPPPLGGAAIAAPGLNSADAIYLRDPQSIFPDSGSIGSGNVPQSVAGSGISPSAVEQGNAVDLKNPQTSLPDPNNQGLGRIPQSVAGGGKSPSALEKGNPTDIQGATPSLPGSNVIGSGNVPQSVAGSGISPSAIEQNNAVDMQNPQTSFPDPNNTRHTTAKQEPAAQSGSNYSSYLESINVFPGFDGKTPLETGNYFELPASLLHLPFDSQQPFDKELAEVVKNMPGVPLVPQLPGAFPSASSFYFLNEKNHLQTLVGGSFGAEKEFKDNNGNVFDVNRVKLDFPVLQEKVNGKPLIWLDNAATTQKPRQVIDRISYFYEHENSNIHRAAHALAARATDAYEDARKKVQSFLNAGSANEIVFVRGTTEAINLVANSWGEQFLNPGDEIILSHLEHHANIVPWQQLAAKKGLKIRVIPVDDDGQVILGEYAKLLGPKTRLVSFSQVSNALGTITPAKEIVD